ncbi:MAG TPA: urea ABC transporter permease subunit UrtC [Rhodopila sp.]|nr:urea ABC transporter permease subunit UrtC [Rhodopila sp.]
MKSTIFDRTSTSATAILAAMVVLLPVLGLGAVPGVSLPLYGVNLAGQVMCFALLAMSVDLIWGGAGVLSLGHGLFFALGGYIGAMHLLRSAYHATHALPDFLVFMGEKAFPGWWHFADSAVLTLVAVLVLPALVALVFGYVSFRSKVNGVYFSIITQALTYAAMLLMFRNDTGFGGNNGMTGFHDVMGLPIGGLKAAVLLATVATALVLATLVGGRVLLASRFGRMMVAIRDDEPRLRFLGYDTLWLKLGVWCLSAALAALAGMLYVPQVGIINPTLLDPSLSLEIPVWVAIGGRGGLCGAVLGAVLVNLLKSWLSVAAPGVWPFVLSLMVLFVVLLLPIGLLDIRNRSRAWLTQLSLPGVSR